jgi:hypothetical protein
MPTRRCTTCGDTFYTQVGLDEHVRLDRHNGQTRRWITGRVSPDGLLRLQERGRQIAAQNNARRRMCKDCDRISTPAAIGLHQKNTGHVGWIEL